MIHRAIDSEQVSGAVRREGAVHEIWSLRLGMWLGKGNDPRYTPTTTFEMFPFPLGLTPDVPAADYADDSARPQWLADAHAALDAAVATAYGWSADQLLALNGGER